MLIRVAAALMALSLGTALGAPAPQNDLDVESVIKKLKATGIRPELRRPGGMVEREPLPKKPTDALAVPPHATGRLLVKFNDAAKVRAMPDGSIASTNFGVAVTSGLETCNALLADYGVSFVKAINHPDEVLQALQSRAAASSGRAQPDLAGMMHVEGIGSEADLLAVARTINDLPCVEWVEFELPVSVIGNPPDGLGSQIITTGPLVEGANQMFGVSASIVTNLLVPPVPAAGMQIQVPLMSGANNVTLELEPYSIRGNGFQMLALGADGPQPINMGAPRTVRGSVAGQPGSMVAGSVLENGLYAMIQLEDGSRYWVQPLVGSVDGGAPGQHAIYRNDDLIPNPNHICGTEGEPLAGLGHGHAMPMASGPQGGVAGPAIEYTELTLDLDSTWVNGFPSVAASGFYAMAIINVVNIQYETEVSISHVVNSVIARTNPATDPFADNDNAITLIDEFQQVWNDDFPVGTYPRDLAHLFTGHELQGSIIGIARSIGTICDVANSYSLSQRFGGFACQTDLTAHEFGHNWNAVHCSCFSSTDPSSNFTMNPFITCANQFSPGTITSIGTYRDSRACLDLGTPPAGCGVPANDCMTASGAPYCSDTLCCGAVCAVMPECCDTAWDASCVALAADICFECGDAGAGSCFEANFTPFCADADCCMLVGAFEAACAAGVWDEQCAILATLLCPSDDDDPTPNLQSFQAYLTEEATPGFGVVSELATGTAFNGEGFDVPGLHDLGAELESLGVGVNGARGRNVRIAAVESAAYVDHEDLDVILEPGQTMWFNDEVTDPNHGTAVLGIMNAQEQTPARGMVGFAPDAEAYFFPTFSLEEGGRLLSAITSALNTFSAGDVINYSIGFGPDGCLGGDCGAYLLTSSAGVYTLVRLGSDLGITSVVSAGNQGCNLDDNQEAGPDSGAIIVGAVFPGLPFCRIGFSNHSEDGGPDALPHYSAWGAAVATTGYGDLYGPLTDPNRQYTYTFGGTSAAAPMVAGLVGCLQGLMKQFYGIPLLPEQVRGNIQLWCQCLTCVDDQLPTQEDGDECNGDTLDPEEEDIHLIGGVPVARGWAITLLTNDFFGDPSQLEEIVVARGTHELGNHFSVRSFDTNYLVVESEYTLAGQHSDASAPGGAGISQSIIDSITYIVNGHVTDVLAAGRVPSADETDLGVTMIWQNNQTHYLFVEAYDWSSGRFIMTDFFPTLPPNTVFGQAVLLPRAGRFVNGQSKRVVVRLWTFSFPNGDLGNGPLGPNGGPPSRMFWDQISITNGVEPGEVTPP